VLGVEELERLRRLGAQTRQHGGVLLELPQDDGSIEARLNCEPGHGRSSVSRIRCHSELRSVGWDPGVVAWLSVAVVR